MPNGDSRAADAPSQRWDPALYDGRHSFVYKAAEGLLELLAPRPGERILDLGCGTGHLTARIAEAGALVRGVDSSADMVEQAQRNFPRLDFAVADATSLTVDVPRDAVFSNAVLHWVRPPAAAVARIAAALRPGGRFVAEFGGRGCMEQVIRAVNAALSSDDLARCPWYFPSVAEYAAILEAHGFEVRLAMLFDRPTPLEDGAAGLRNWLAMFGAWFFAGLDAARRGEVLDEVERRLRPTLWHEDRWVADYRRLRLVAVKLA